MAPIAIADDLPTPPYVTEKKSLQHENPFEQVDNRYSLKRVITDPIALSAERVTVKINELSINGFASQNGSVANFRGVQYAHIGGRWHQAQPIDPSKISGSIEATQWGARSPQMVDVLHDATSHLYPRMGTFDRQSEFECLNLNIYAPRDSLSRGGRGLPCLVWIHGGAFLYGDGGCEFDGQYLVRRSIDNGEPIVVVGLNYRLGALGFLSSHELRDEARARGETGYNNLGLHDQRVALQWIAKHIHRFGGDGSRITVAGESAGAISIFAHIRGNAPVFKNAIIMSCASMAPGPVEECQRTFDTVIDALGHGAAPAHQKLAALRSTSPQELQALLGKSVPQLSDDENFFAQRDDDEAWEQLKTIPSWLKAMVIGQTREENMLFAQRWAATSAGELFDDLSTLHEDESYSHDFLKAYDVTRESSHGELVKAFSDYTSDTLFSHTTYSIATTHLQHSPPSAPKVYRYSFDQPDLVSKNPVFNGSAYHSQDNAFLFYYPQVAGSNAPQEFVATAKAFSGAALSVIHGREPWESVEVKQGYLSLCGSKTGVKAEADPCMSRWLSLTNSPERFEMFMKGKELLFRAMTYAMVLPLESERQRLAGL